MIYRSRSEMLRVLDYMQSRTESKVYKETISQTINLVAAAQEAREAIVELETLLATLSGSQAESTIIRRLRKARERLTQLLKEDAQTVR